MIVIKISGKNDNDVSDENDMWNFYYKYLRHFREIQF